MIYGYYQPYWNLDNNELEHFGILGMKWGIRRYQNKDGTLTEKGKKRYGTVENMRDVRQRSKERRQAAFKVAKTGIKIATAVGLIVFSDGIMNSAASSVLGTSTIKTGAAAASSILLSEGRKRI